jgi:hypothetical protein
MIPVPILTQRSSIINSILEIMTNILDKNASTAHSFPVSLFAEPRLNMLQQITQSMITPLTRPTSKDTTINRSGKTFPTQEFLCQTPYIRFSGASLTIPGLKMIKCSRHDGELFVAENTNRAFGPVDQRMSVELVQSHEVFLADAAHQMARDVVLLQAQHGGGEPVAGLAVEVVPLEVVL